MPYVSMKISPRKLRELIDKAGFNFSEFGREVLVSKEAMRGYTADAEFAPIKPEILRRIADKLGVSIDELRIPDDPTNGEAPPNGAEALRKIEKIAKAAGLSDDQLAQHFGFRRQAASKKKK